MLEKGIVLEIKEQYAIVLLPGGEMIRIKRKDGLKVGAQIYILPEDHYTDSAEPSVVPFPARNQMKSTDRRQKLLRQIAGLAAVFVLIVTMVLYPSIPTVYAVASFDGEQDLQLELDRKSRIMNGYSYGEQLPEENLQKLKGQKLADVGEELTAFLGNGPVLIGYASYQEDAEGDAQTEQMLREMFSNHIILYLSGNGEDIELAESAKMSLGFHLAGEVVDQDTREILDEFLEAYTEYREELEDFFDAYTEYNDELEDFLKAYIKYQEKLNQTPDSKDEDLSHLNDMDFDELLDEIHHNPAYEGNDDVLEILADKLEELHEDQKEQTWEQDEDDSDASDTDSEDSDSDHANEDRGDADDEDSDDND